MKGKVLVVGYGRVGKAVALLLCMEGYNVVIADISDDKLKLASESLKVETLKVNILDDAWTRNVTKDFDVVCTALPGTIGFKAIRDLIAKGVNTIDVSYFPEDPFILDLEAKRSRCHVVVDAGVAPGLSSMLAGRAYKELKGFDTLEIYVGGLPENPKDKPLGMLITWSPIDLLDEYVRPARIKVNGKIIAVDPLSITGNIELPGLGVYEYFVSDGLRTMLKTFKNVKNMYEFTIRYKGHINIMKTFKDLGMLSWNTVDVYGVKIKPIHVLAKLLELSLQREEPDITILHVKAVKGDLTLNFTLYDKYDSKLKLSSMSRTTGFTQALIAIASIKGLFERDVGLITPEELGLWDKTYTFVINKLKTLNVEVKKSVQALK